MNTKTKYLILAVIVVVFIPTIFLVYRQYTLKQAQKRVGTIEINVSIYDDADKGLSDIHFLNVSKMYYLDNLLIEEVEMNDTIMFCVFNSKFHTDFTTDIDSLALMKPHNIESKKHGTLFLGTSIPNYSDRMMMNDTILDQIHYKRFAIKSENEYSVFYLQDKLNIPYSFNKKAEDDYSGTITRIDTYNISDDRFISITLNSKNKIQRQFYNNLSNNFFKYKRHEKI